MSVLCLCIVWNVQVVIFPIIIRISKHFLIERFQKISLSLSETAKRLKSFFNVMNAAASSVTILGDFLKFLWHIFSLKLPKYIKTFWGATLKNIPFKTKTAVVTLRLLLIKIWAPLHFNIWSHWLRLQTTQLFWQKYPKFLDDLCLWKNLKNILVWSRADYFKTHFNIQRREIFC